MHNMKSDAVISDIHGNQPALQAVLRQIEETNAEQIVVCGDVAAGPMPRETLTLLQNLPLPAIFIRGNADREMTHSYEGAEPDPNLPDHVQEVIRWTSAQITAEQYQLMTNFVANATLTIDGLGDVLFCHATASNDTDIFTKITPEVRLSQLFAGVTADLVMCGHTHMQFDRTVGNLRIVNAGSVGMPYGQPGAYWALLGPDVQLIRTIYDLQSAAQLIRNTAYPQAADFADNNILNPPSEEEALAVFEKPT
jgi:putative phosphoesterase